MDQGVVGLMCRLLRGRVGLDMPIWLRIDTAVESCKPCQGTLPSARRAAAFMLGAG